MPRSWRREGAVAFFNDLTALLPRSTTRRWPRDARPHARPRARRRGRRAPGAPHARAREARRALRRHAPADRLPALATATTPGSHDVWVAQQFNPISLSDHLANGRAVGPRPHDGRPLIARSRGWATTAARASDRDGRRALAQRADDPRVRARGARRAQRRRRLHARLRRARRRARRGRRGGDDGHDRGRARTTPAATASCRPTAGAARLRLQARRPGGQPDLQRGLRVRARPRCSTGSTSAGEDAQRGSRRRRCCRAWSTPATPREHRFDGFWRDVGTIDAYRAAHMELLAEPPPIDLDDPGWPILTRADRAPRVGARAARAPSSPTSLLAPARPWPAAWSAR